MRVPGKINTVGSQGSVNYTSKINILRKIILFIFSFLIVNSSYSQFVTQWERRFNSILEDYASSMTVDNLGNVYVTGTGYVAATGFDYLTIKYDANGNEQWIRTYNGVINRIDQAYSIDVDNSGNVYVTGTSSALSFNPFDYATVKYNSVGTQLWAARYNGGSQTYDEAYVVKVDNSGNVYVTGASESTGSFSDYTTIKYDSTGKEVWVVKYNGPGDFKDIPASMVIDNTGNLYVTGKSFGNGTDYDYATIKYDGNGNRLWAVRHNGSADSIDAAHSLAIDNSGNVYVTGESMNTGTGLDYVTIKYDLNGNHLWTALFNNAANKYDIAMDVAVNDSGDVYVTGFFQLPGPAYGSDYATIKYDSDGNQIWAKTFSGTKKEGNDQATFIELDSLGNIYVGGYTVSASTYSFDYTVLKYNSNGDQLATAFFNGTGNGTDVITDMIIDNFNNVYVTGYSYSSANTDYDYLTIKYSQTVGIQNTFEENPEIFKLYNNYPNPFNPKTTISYQIPKQTSVSLRIFNSLGKEVTTLVNAEQNPGTYLLNFDGSNISSGIYFYTLQTEEFTQTKSMVLLK